MNILQLRSNISYTNVNISDDSLKTVHWRAAVSSSINNSNTMADNSADSRTPHDIYLEVSISAFYYFHQELLLTIGKARTRGTSSQVFSYR